MPKKELSFTKSRQLRGCHIFFRLIHTSLRGLGSVQWRSWGICNGSADWGAFLVIYMLYFEHYPSNCKDVIADSGTFVMGEQMFSTNQVVMLLLARCCHQGMLGKSSMTAISPYFLPLAICIATLIIIIITLITTISTMIIHTILLFLAIMIMHLPYIPIICHWKICILYFSRAI